MTKTIEEATQEFAAFLEASDVYQEYRRYLAELKSYPELYEKANDYRQRVFDLQTKEPEDGLLEKIERLEAEYENILSNDLVNDFLRAELAYCRMIQNVNKTLALTLEFE